MRPPTAESARPVARRPKPFAAPSRRELAKDRWHEFGDRWVDRHHARIGGAVTPASIASITPWMASSPPTPRMAAPRIASVSRVDDDLHEALRLAFLDRAADAGHRAAADADARPVARACGLGHADPAERRIDVERVSRNAVADLARGAVEQVRGDDLEIVVGGMGEGAARRCSRRAPRYAGTLVCSDRRRRCSRARRRLTPALSRPRSSVFGRRPTASSTCEPRTSGSPAAQSTPTAISAPRGSKRMHSAFEPTLDALRLEDVADRVRDVLVLARDQPRPLFHDRHRRSEPAKHLRELEADVAAADDDEVPRQGVELKQRRVGQRPHLIATRKIGHCSPGRRR